MRGPPLESLVTTQTSRGFYLTKGLEPVPITRPMQETTESHDQATLVPVDYKSEHPTWTTSPGTVVDQTAIQTEEVVQRRQESDSTSNETPGPYTDTSALTTMSALPVTVHEYVSSKAPTERDSGPKVSAKDEADPGSLRETSRVVPRGRGRQRRVRVRARPTPPTDQDVSVPSVQRATSSRNVFRGHARFSVASTQSSRAVHIATTENTPRTRATSVGSYRPVEFDENRGELAEKSLSTGTPVTQRIISTSTEAILAEEVPAPIPVAETATAPPSSTVTVSTPSFAYSTMMKVSRVTKSGRVEDKSREATTSLNVRESTEMIIEESSPSSWSSTTITDSSSSASIAAYSVTAQTRMSNTVSNSANVQSRASAISSTGTEVGITTESTIIGSDFDEAKIDDEWQTTTVTTRNEEANVSSVEVRENESHRRRVIPTETAIEAESETTTTTETETASATATATATATAAAEVDDTSPSVTEASFVPSVSEATSFLSTDVSRIPSDESASKENNLDSATTSSPSVKVELEASTDRETETVGTFSTSTTVDQSPVTTTTEGHEGVGGSTELTSKLSEPEEDTETERRVGSLATDRVSTMKLSEPEEEEEKERRAGSLATDRVSTTKLSGPEEEEEKERRVGSLVTERVSTMKLSGPEEEEESRVGSSATERVSTMKLSEPEEEEEEKERRVGSLATDSVSTTKLSEPEEEEESRVGSLATERVSSTKLSGPEDKEKESTSGSLATERVSSTEASVREGARRRRVRVRVLQGGGFGERISGISDENPGIRVKVYKGRQNRGPNGELVARVTLDENPSEREADRGPVESREFLREQESNSRRRVIIKKLKERTESVGEEVEEERAVGPEGAEVKISSLPRKPSPLTVNRFRKPSLSTTSAPVTDPPKESSSSSSKPPKVDENVGEGDESGTKGDVTEGQKVESLSDQSGKAQELAVTLSDPPALQSSGSGQRTPSFTQRRRISTTASPRTGSTTTTTTTATTRRRQPVRNRHKTTTRQADPVTSRPRRPMPLDYDYYEDEDQPLVLKSAFHGKIYLSNRGTIRCMDQGNFPHPYSCKKFITCARIVSGQVIGAEYTCPDKLSFDPVGGICNWSAGLGCKE